MKDLKKIVWDERAVAQFEKICNYIVEQSPQNADNLKTEIIHALEKIPANPKNIRQISIEIKTREIIALSNCTMFALLIKLLPSTF